MHTAAKAVSLSPCVSSRKHRARATALRHLPDLDQQDSEVALGIAAIGRASCGFNVDPRTQATRDAD
jgi:hypothetical protein